MLNSDSPSALVIEQPSSVMMSRKVGWTVMLLAAVGVAGYAALNLGWPALRSPFVQNLFNTAPAAIAIHLGGGLVAMVLGAWQLNSRLRKQFLSAHRWLGRVYVFAVVIGGIAGLILALDSSGGLAAHFGFGLMAIFWLATTLNAYRHIRNGNVAEHRAWMLRSYALTLAGVTLRIYLGLGFALGVEFSAFYPAISWLCWVPNLLIVEWFVLAKPYRTSSASAPAQ